MYIKRNEVSDLCAVNDMSSVYYMMELEKVLEIVECCSVSPRVQ
jgi:hypothetical protein